MQREKSVTNSLLLGLLMIGCIFLPLHASAAPGYLSPNTPAKGLFLVASDTMTDPRFVRSVILLVSVDSSGSMGVVINGPTQYLLSEVISELKDDEAGKHHVYIGGPVMTAFSAVLFRSYQPPGLSHHVTGDIYFSSDKQVLLHQVRTSSQETKVFYGHTGWAPGQLKMEIERGGWRLVAEDPSIVFLKNTENIWHELISTPDGRWTSNEPEEGQGLFVSQILPVMKE